MTDSTPTILIIDDDTLLRTSMSTQLQASGYSVATAENGKLGYEKALEMRPTVIVMDYQMPEQDGVETIRQLRNDAWGKTVPIIFATNVYDADIVNQLMLLNVPDYLIKTDLSLDALVSQVRKYVVTGG